MAILEGYGVGPNTLGLLSFYWKNQRCVARSENYETTSYYVILATIFDYFD